MFRRGSNSTNDFTILFDVPNTSEMTTTTTATTANINNNNINATTEEEFMSDPYTYYSSSSSSCSSPVDCTLSLGPASTRQSTRITGSSSSVPRIYWDVLPRSKQSPSSPGNNNNGLIARGGGGGGGGGSAADFLLPRRCANCDTTSTPLWRNGPRGPKSLCNACGIRYKKEERLAAAATTTAPPYSPSGGAPAAVHVHPWAAYQPVVSRSEGIRKNTQQTSSMSVDEHTPIPYYSWCL